MVTATIFLASTFREDLPTGLALCIVPFILGWLFAYIFHRVNALNEQVVDLTGERDKLTARVHGLEGDITDVRMKLSQTEADLYSRSEQVAHLRDELMLVESERNMLKEKYENN